MSLQLDIPAGARVIKSGADRGSCQAAVLNLSDLAAQARQVVLDARREAARIAADALAAAESVREQASGQGYAQGLARGLAEGRAQGERQALAELRERDAAQSAEAVDLARQILGELSAAKDGLLRQARRQMLAFSLELASKIVGQVAATDIGAAKDNLAKALSLANCGGEIVVRVNSGQLDALRRQCPQVVAALGVQGEVRLEADESIAPGGVRLLSRSGEIDATIQTQLANVAASLLGQGHQPLLFGLFVTDKEAAAGAAPS